MAVPLKPFRDLIVVGKLVCPLTAGELRALWAVARYGGYEQAALHIGCHYQTIKNTVTSIHRKLGVATTVTAVAYAVERGWLFPITQDLLFLEECDRYIVKTVPFP